MKSKKRAMRKRIKLITTGEIDAILPSGEEVAILIRNARRVKHRMLVELVYKMRLSVEEAVNIRLNEIDPFSGILYLPSRNTFCKIPSKLLNLMRFHLKTQSPKQFLLETMHGPLKEEAAEKIIQTLALRYLGEEITSYELQQSFLKSTSFYSQQSHFYLPSHHTSFKINALPSF